jgi:hypothetical protein
MQRGEQKAEGGEQMCFCACEQRGESRIAGSASTCCLRMSVCVSVCVCSNANLHEECYTYAITML